MGRVLTRLVAIDGDLSSNGALVYSLQQLSPTNGVAYFIIHPLTGDLIVAQTLDLETIYELQITAIVRFFYASVIIQ